MDFHPRSFLTLVIVVALGIGIATSLTWPLRANILVLTIGGACWVTAVVQLILEMRPGHKSESSGMDIDLTEDQQLEKAPMRALDISLWLVGLVAGIWLFGLYLAVSAWSFLYAFRHGSRWWMAAIIAAICWGFMYGLFDQVVHMPFPEPLIPLPSVLTGI